MLSMADLGSSALLKGVLELLDGQGDSVGRTMDPWVDLVSQVDDGFMWSESGTAGWPFPVCRAQPQELLSLRFYHLCFSSSSKFQCWFVMPPESHLQECPQIHLRHTPNSRA